MRKRIPVWRKDQKPERLDWRNCAIREFTGDGISSGRCMHYVGHTYICPLHGDVAEVQKRFRETGRLTNDPRMAEVIAAKRTKRP